MDFNRALFELADRLGHQDVVVARVHADWASFGSWSLEVTAAGTTGRYAEALKAGRYDTHGPDVLRCVWDGRDRLLFLSVGITPPLSGATGWVSTGEDRCADVADAIAAAERRIVEWVVGQR